MPSVGAVSKPPCSEPEPPVRAGDAGACRRISPRSHIRGRNLIRCAQYVVLVPARVRVGRPVPANKAFAVDFTTHNVQFYDALQSAEWTPSQSRNRHGDFRELAGGRGAESGREPDSDSEPEREREPEPEPDSERRYPGRGRHGDGDRHRYGASSSQAGAPPQAPSFKLKYKSSR